MPSVFTMEAGTEGEAIVGNTSGGNAGATTVSKTGGSATRLAAAKFAGSFGVRFISAANNGSFGRWPTPVASTTMAEAFDFRIVGHLPTTADMTLATKRFATGAIVLIQVTTAGKIRVLASGITVVPLFPTTSATILPDVWYRLAYSITSANSVKVRIYPSGSNTWTTGWGGETTTATLNAGAQVSSDIGVAATGVPEAMTVDIDNVQFVEDSTQYLSAYDPAANTKPTITSTSANQTVALNSTASVTAVAVDAEGTIASRAWTWDYYPPELGTAPTITGGTTATATFTPTVAGLYRLKHIATDDGGLASDPAYSKVFVTAQQVRPIAVTSAGGWTAVGAADAAAALRDNVDTSYADSPSTGSSEQNLRLRLAPMPVMSSFAISYRDVLPDSGTGTFKVRVYEGSTLRAEWTVNPAAGSLTDRSVSMSSAQLASVTAAGWLELDVEFSRI